MTIIYFVAETNQQAFFFFQSSLIINQGVEMLSSIHGRVCQDRGDWGKSDL